MNPTIAHIDVATCTLRIIRKGEVGVTQHKTERLLSRGRVFCRTVMVKNAIVEKCGVPTKVERRGFGFLISITRG